MLDREDAYDLAGRAVKALEKIAELAQLEIDQYRKREQFSALIESFGNGPIVPREPPSESTVLLSPATAETPAAAPVVVVAPAEVASTPATAAETKAPSAG